MKGKHTPGPWYTASTGNHQGLIISEKTGENVAISYDSEDADLIAAAPEMLALLKELAAWLICPDCSPETIEHIREKIVTEISKAEGETP